tara:strand:+ start:1594 stop:1725 length:132 start_codon:yes stop_codon:yes gene_type:complete
MAKITIEIDTNSQNDLELVELVEKLVSFLEGLTKAEEQQDEES